MDACPKADICAPGVSLEKETVMRAVVVAVIALLVSGCATMQVEVSVFHDLSPTAQPRKYAIVPTKDQEASLEHKAFRDRVRTEMKKRGYIETSEPEADVHVFLFYGVDAGQERVSSYSITGQTGTQYMYVPAPLPPPGIPSYRSGTKIGTPTFGVVGTGTTCETFFGSYLLLDMVDRAESVKAGKVTILYEAKVVSIGPSGLAAVTVPVMIDALFQDFPGKSGSTRSLSMPLQR